MQFCALTIVLNELEKKTSDIFPQTFAKLVGGFLLNKILLKKKDGE